MSIDRLLEELNEARIRLSLNEEGGLKIRGPSGSLSDDVKSRIASHRDEIVKLLGQQGKGRRPTRRINRIERGARFPLSFAQRRIWFQQQVSQNKSLHNLAAAIEGTGRISTIGLQEALNQLVRRHEPLRSVFNQEDGEVYQEILDGCTVNLTMLNVESREQALRAARSLRSEPFDLAVDPKIRAALVCWGHDLFLFQICMHHIVGDAHSLSILTADLNMLYTLSERQSEVEPERLSFQYIDYVDWEQNIPAASREAALDYWRHKLADVPERHSFPLDCPGARTHQNKGEALSCCVDGETMLGLQTVANQECTSLFVVLYCAYVVLLTTYSREPDVVIGVPATGRPLSETDSMVGCFLNNLVLRTDVSGCQNFKNAIARCKETVLGAFDHQDVPFEALVDHLKPLRVEGVNPIYQITMAYDVLGNVMPDWPGVDSLPVKIEPETSEFDLSLLISEQECGLDITWLFDTALFRKDSIEKLALSFDCLLNSLARNYTAEYGTMSWVVDLPIISMVHGPQDVKLAEEPEDILSIFNSTVARHPTKIALVGNGGGLAFSQLAQRVSELASMISEVACSSPNAIAVCIEHSVDAVVAIIAVLQSGHAFVPLDPAWPPSRKKAVVESAGCCATIECDDPRNNVFRVTRTRRDGAAQESTPSFDNNSTERLAYIMYTSGTTGEPKGVAVTRRSLSHYVAELFEQLNRMQLDWSISWLWSASYQFDASIKGIVALCNGAKLVVPTVQQQRDVAELVRLSSHHSVEVLNFSPSLMQIALEELSLQNSYKPHLIASGDRISRDLWLELADYSLENCVVSINAYGPTEATVNAAFGVVEKDRPPNIGRPSLNHSIYVVGGNGELLPVGAVGELWIQGPGVAKGYVGSSEHGGSGFCQRPSFGSRPVYRTGDFGRYLPSGKIEFWGRRDSQVKVRGFRVELDSIRQLVLESTVASDAVVYQPVTVAEGNIVAVFVAKAESPAEPASIVRRFLASRLPAHELPALVVEVDRISRKVDGSADFAVLDEQVSGTDANQVDAAQELTETERSLTELWKSLLGRDSVSVHDNFFAIGGHSLLAMKLVARMSETLAIRLPIRVVLSSPTIAELAWLVDNGPNTVINGGADGGPTIKL